jgi:hypothetical protein
MEHPISDASLQRFACGTATGEEGRAVLVHLLRGCALCSHKLSALTGLDKPEKTLPAPVPPRRTLLRRPATVQ